MSKNVFEDFLYSIKRNIVYRNMVRWKRNNTTVPASAIKRVKPEFQDLARQMYIRRSFEGSDIFVDLYWYLKRSENIKHEDYIYYRCNWTVAKKIIERVESRELPERINQMFDNNASKS